MADEDDDPDNSGEIYEAMDKGKKQQADANTTYKTERKEERKRVAELKKELAVVAGNYYYLHIDSFIFSTVHCSLKAIIYPEFCLVHMYLTRWFAVTFVPYLGIVLLRYT